MNWLQIALIIIIMAVFFYFEIRDFRRWQDNREDSDLLNALVEQKKIQMEKERNTLTVYLDINTPMKEVILDALRKKIEQGHRESDIKNIEIIVNYSKIFGKNILVRVE